MPEQWLSYEQIGQSLGISTAAARHKVSRIRLARRLRNDGLAEVLADIEELRAQTPKRAPKRRSAAAPAAPETAQIEVLNARLVELEARLTDARSVAERARSDADRERADRLDAIARADRISSDLAEVARRLAELTAAAQARRPSSLPRESPAQRSWWRPFRRYA